MREPGAPDFRYVRARRALLDVLEALGNHRNAVVLVGAQAVYLNVGEARQALSSFTTDADLALNPELLASEPALQEVLTSAGFERRGQPGLWFDANGVEVDLLVPASISGHGRRGVDLGKGHERTAAMRVVGLEAALVDNSQREVKALDPADPRAFVISVAGPAALVVSKLHKIADRSEGTAQRLQNKDASDLFLLLQGTQTQDLSRPLLRMSRDDRIAPVVDTALTYLETLFTTNNGQGLRLLRDAIRGLEDEETTVQSCMALARDLLSAMGR
jgi:hypothetical protein